MSAMSTLPIDALKELLIGKQLAIPDGADSYYHDRAGEAIADGKLELKDIMEVCAKSAAGKREEVIAAVADRVVVQIDQKSRRRTPHLPNARDVFSGAIEGREPSERYSHAKYPAKHVKTGETVFDGATGREVETISEFERTAFGVLIKQAARRSGLQAVIDDHEQKLLGELTERYKWCGRANGQYVKSFGDKLVTKSLLSDTTSGGIELVPEFFDANLVQFPLLYGELAPMVTTREVPRGRTVETASVGNPTVDWNINEGTAISLFDTDALVLGIDATIFPVTAALTVGLDHLADAAADIGRVLLENVGQSLQKELDKVIAVGDGTTQPEGIFTASGVVSATTGGTWTVDDVEELLFAIGKQYRTSSKCCFVMNDTTYARVRALSNDPAGTTDVRRVFGMDHESYALLARPAKIQNNIANTKAAFGDLSRYVLWRRLGFQVEWERGGETLRRRNEALLIVRGRFAGKVVDANAFAVATDAPA